jgi:hypothetical protein
MKHRLSDLMHVLRRSMEWFSLIINLTAEPAKLGRTLLTDGIRFMALLAGSRTSLGPDMPDPPVDLPVTAHKHRHRIPSHCKVVAHPILGGLHHEYGLAAKAARIFAGHTGLQ